MIPMPKLDATNAFTALAVAALVSVAVSWYQAPVQAAQTAAQISRLDERVTTLEHGGGEMSKESRMTFAEVSRGMERMQGAIDALQSTLAQGQSRIIEILIQGQRADAAAKR